MQARKTKLDRILTRAARAAARPAARIARRVARLDASIPMSPRKAAVNEARKRAAAQPDAIKAVRAAYRYQCATNEAAKALDREEKRRERLNATIPAEAASNETR